MAFKQIDLSAPLRKIEFLVPGLIPLGYVTFLGAREGVGKTTLLTSLAWQMTRPDGQGEFMGEAIPQGPVIYLNTDAADGEARSVRHWLEQHRQTFPDGSMSGVTVLEPTGAGISQEELGDLLNMARELKARCVIVDSFMSTFVGLDANRLEQAMQPMLALRNFAAQTGAAVVITDHLPKKAPNEKEGDRGIMGSTGKTAQARAVHLLTRVPPRDVDGREVLRWEVRKNSFARSGYSLGLEVDRLEDDYGEAVGVRLVPCDLPDEDEGRDTRTDRAKAAVILALTSKAGEALSYGELLSAAIQGGNLKERMAKEAVKAALGTLGAQVEIKTLPGQGRGRRPQAYTFRHEAPADAATEGNWEGEAF